jgi:3-methyladenine DNA glycosylase/8-oxoguanine DNA glycosylase
LEAKVLSFKHEVVLNPTIPFNFDATLHKPDHFPSADNAWQPGIRWQTMLWDGRTVGLKFENQGESDAPKVNLSIWADEELNEDFVTKLSEEINYRYNLQLDLTDFYHKYQHDSLIGTLIDRWRGMRPFNYGSLYEYLIVAILLQNATVRRSVNMLQALFENYGSCLTFDGKQLFCFWEPEVLEAVREAELRSLKIGYRAKSIKRVTRAFVNCEIDEFGLRDRSKEEQRQVLLSLYGIGPASVGYLLFDVFHQLDEMENISPWEQKIYSKLFFDTEVDEPVPVEHLLGYFNDNFAGYRGLAVHYFWEDLFWRRLNEPVEWLEQLIRL